MNLQHNQGITMPRQRHDPTPRELRAREERFLTIHDRIRLRRKELGLSAAELARQCGVKTQAVQQWETPYPEGTTPRRPLRAKLAAALKITEEWIEFGPKLGHSTASAERAYEYSASLLEQARLKNGLRAQEPQPPEPQPILRARDLVGMVESLPPDAQAAVLAVVQALVNKFRRETR